MRAVSAAASTRASSTAATSPAGVMGRGASRPARTSGVGPSAVSRCDIRQRYAAQMGAYLGICPLWGSLRGGGCRLEAVR
ncbi:unnamed protein product [[Actinomadura] parvosata subsp. kistnae]|nr:unnamed protein product [Actinomadura parvosata subsp. kistnae]